MKRSILILSFIFFIGHAFSQSLAGDWKGKFETTVSGGFILPSDFQEKNFTAIALRFILNQDSSYSVYSFTKGARPGQQDTIVVCKIASRISGDSVFLEEVRVIVPADYPTPCFQKMFLKIRRTKRSTELNGTWESVGEKCASEGRIFFTKQNE